MKLTEIRNVIFFLYLKQVELSHPNAEIRLLEVFYHKIYKVATYCLPQNLLTFKLYLSCLISPKKYALASGCVCDADMYFKCLLPMICMANMEIFTSLLPYFFYLILQIFPLGEKIENINDQYWTLRAEEASLSSFFFPLSDIESSLESCLLMNFII